MYYLLPRCRKTMKCEIQASARGKRVTVKVLIFFIMTLVCGGCYTQGVFPITSSFLEISSINGPAQAQIGAQVSIEVAVRYNTAGASVDILVQVYEHAGPLLAEATRRIQGSGVTLFQFSLRAPLTSRSWQLNVHLFRREREWLQVDIKSLVINITTTSANLQIEEIRFPKQVNVGQRFNLFVTVRYSLPAPTSVLVQVYEHAGPLLATQHTTLRGQGAASFQFDLTAPGDARRWQLNVHLFRFDREWTQVDLQSIHINVQREVQPPPQPLQRFYLYPPVLHLVPGESGLIRAIDDAGREIQGRRITFSVGRSDLFSVTQDGLVTALRLEKPDEYYGSVVWATIDGLRSSNNVIVRVLSTRYDFAHEWIITEHTGLYYPSRVKGENIAHYVQKYEIAQANEYAYKIQSMLLRCVPWNGARQIFAVEFGEGGKEFTPCGIAGNPIRLGWNLLGNEWANCFLVPFMPPRSPQWGVFYHELGHNFTWASDVFSQALGVLEEYSEGLATALGLTAIEIMLNYPHHYPLTSETRESLRYIYNRDTQSFKKKYEDWLRSGIPFLYLDQRERNDIVDGIWFHWKERRSDFAHRFFALLSPAHASELLPVVRKATSDEDRHTLFAALVSAAVGEDLREVFSNKYKFPINSRLFYEFYNAFTKIIR